MHVVDPERLGRAQRLELELGLGRDGGQAHAVAGEVAQRDDRLERGDAATGHHDVQGFRRRHGLTVSTTGARVIRSARGPGAADYGARTRRRAVRVAGSVGRMNGDEPGWALAAAFAAGVLIGAERERHKRSRRRRKPPASGRSAAGASPRRSAPACSWWSARSGGPARRLSLDPAAPRAHRSVEARRPAGGRTRWSPGRRLRIASTVPEMLAMSTPPRARCPLHRRKRGPRACSPSSRESLAAIRVTSSSWLRASAGGRCGRSPTPRSCGRVLAPPAGPVTSHSR